MKYLRVKIKREANPGGGTHYVYPPQYNAMAVKFGPSYETFNPNKMAMVKARPVPHEYCVIAVEDAEAVKFLASPDIEEIAEPDFVFNLEDNAVPQTEFIEDEQVVLKILEKVRKGTPLSQKDLDAIDGTKAERGIRKSKTMSEHWADRKIELGIV